MKTTVLRWLCEYTGNIVRAIGILLMVLSLSADLDHSSLIAVIVLMAISVALIAIGSFLENYLWFLWKQYVKRKRRELKKRNELKAA